MLDYLIRERLVGYMTWLIDLFSAQTALQAVILIFVIMAIGLALGRLKIAGISLGATFVFFLGILAGHLGFAIDHQMLLFAEDFGLILFVYALGLQVGPGFFNAFKVGGVKLNLLGLGVVLIGTLMTVIFSFTTQVSLPDMVGILCGASTNTPALGAAQQTLRQLSLPDTSPALACAVIYPIGVLGVIISLIIIRKFFVKSSDLDKSQRDKKEHTYLSVFQVLNPSVFNKTIEDVAKEFSYTYVISRLWRDNQVQIPTSKTVLEEGDRLLIITSEEQAQDIAIVFGKQEKGDWNKGDIDWDTMDSGLASHIVVVTSPKINGKKISSLRLRNNFGVNITRIFRSGVIIPAKPNLILRMGDRLVVVGKRQGLERVESYLGNTVKNLNEPNLISISVGIVLGLLLGSIPIMIPGISAPVKLGLAGGPIVVGILIGAFGPRIHMVSYTTDSANLMLRRLGLSMYLACLGLDAGKEFFTTVFCSEGLVWILLGTIITIIPVVIMGVLAIKIWKVDYGNVSGMLCASMANPMALSYASDTVKTDRPAVSYATVYPLSMFIRVIIAQLLILFF